MLVAVNKENKCPLHGISEVDVNMMMEKQQKSEYETETKTGQEFYNCLNEPCKNINMINS